MILPQGKNLRPMCEALIDQGKRIGDDPVGFACTNFAERKTWHGDREVYLCARCVALLVDDPTRVSFPMPMQFIEHRGFVYAPYMPVLPEEVEVWRRQIRKKEKAKS